MLGQGEASSLGRVMALHDPSGMMFADNKGCRVSDLMPGHLVPGSDSAERPWWEVDAHKFSWIPTNPHGLPAAQPLGRVVREDDCGESHDKKERD